MLSGWFRPRTLTDRPAATPQLYLHCSEDEILLQGSWSVKGASGRRSAPDVGCDRLLRSMADSTCCALPSCRLARGSTVDAGDAATSLPGSDTTAARDATFAAAIRSDACASAR
jgi:hypothetical protein